MRKKRLFIFCTIIFFLASFIIFSYKFGPRSIVDLIGIENTYLVLFLVAMIGGVSSITTTSFYALFIAFILGGANPFLLAILGGIGLTIGDTLFFYVGYKGREVAVKSRYKNFVHKMTKWVNSHSKRLVFILIYLYVAVSPFPKDVLSTSLGITNFKFKFSIIAFLLGNLTHCVMIAIFLITN